MPMTPRSNSLSMSVARDLRVLVHLADERPDFAVGELVDAVAEQPLVLGQGGQRRACGSYSIGHVADVSIDSGRHAVLAGASV